MHRQIVQHLETAHGGPVRLRVQRDRDHVSTLSRYLGRLEPSSDRRLCRKLADARGRRGNGGDCALRDRSQLLHHRAHVQRGVLSGDKVVTQHLQPIQAHQQHIDQLRSDRLRPLADTIQQILHGMSQARHFGEPKHSG